MQERGTSCRAMQIAVMTANTFVRLRKYEVKIDKKEETWGSEMGARQHDNKYYLA